VFFQYRRQKVITWEETKHWHILTSFVLLLWRRMMVTLFTKPYLVAKQRTSGEHGRFSA
jgi:hypothetical protein